MNHVLILYVFCIYIPFSPLTLLVEHQEGCLAGKDHFLQGLGEVAKNLFLSGIPCVVWSLPLCDFH